ncbi:MAG: hypothetical protein V3V62_08745, partial [bacterium]
MSRIEFRLSAAWAVVRRLAPPLCLAALLAGCVAQEPEVKLAVGSLTNGSGTAEAYYHYIIGLRQEIAGNIK